MRNALPAERPRCRQRPATPSKSGAAMRSNVMAELVLGAGMQRHRPCSACCKVGRRSMGASDGLPFDPPQGHPLQSERLTDEPPLGPRVFDHVVALRAAEGQRLAGAGGRLPGLLTIVEVTTVQQGAELAWLTNLRMKR